MKSSLCGFALVSEPGITGDNALLVTTSQYSIGRLEGKHISDDAQRSETESSERLLENWATRRAPCRHDIHLVAAFNFRGLTYHSPSCVAA
jgi:hypothetical protein